MYLGVGMLAYKSPFYKVKNFFKTQHNEIHYHRPLLHSYYCYPCIIGRALISNQSKNPT